MIGGELQTGTECLTSCSVRQQVNYMGPPMFIHVKVWIPDGSEFKVSESLDESVELLSENSLLPIALRFAKTVRRVLLAWLSYHA